VNDDWLEQVYAWPDDVAVEQTPCMRVLLTESGIPNLGRLRALETAAEAVRHRRRIEMDAEAAHRRAELRVRHAQEALLGCVVPRLEVSDRSVLRARLAARVQTWADPYASDTTGEPALTSMLALIDGATVALPGVREAVVCMGTAGRAYDRAEGARSHAIAARVSARHAWNAVAASVLESTGVDAVQRWLALASKARQVPFPEDAWFAVGEE